MICNIVSLGIKALINVARIYYEINIIIHLKNYYHNNDLVEIVDWP